MTCRCCEQSQIDAVCLWSAFGSIGDTASPLTLRATRIQDPKTGTKVVFSFGYITTTSCTKSPDKKRRLPVKLEKGQPLWRGTMSISWQLQLYMYMGFLCADPQASLTSYAILGVCNGHYLIAHVVSVLVLAFKRFLYEHKHISAADFITSPAADAFIRRRLIR